jgi:HD-GYP domain-containing protein (c-di-GMP phosphodiesterase class II)
VFKGYIEFKMPSDIKGIGFFILFTALTESCSVVFKNLSISTGFAVLMSSYLLFGPLWSMLIAIVGFSFRFIKSQGKTAWIFNTALYKTFFNYCDFALLIMMGNFLYTKSGGTTFINGSYSLTMTNIIALILFVASYIITNAAVMAGLVSNMTNSSFLYYFINNIRLSTLSNFMLAPFGVFLAVKYVNNSFSWVILFVFTLMLAKYIFALYDDSKNKFIQTVNALTRAIEARDKYTEGHSLRVSEMSACIAKEMRINDWKIEQLKIAALLHDVGKIGIDDAVLNKPGRLTDEEYSMIKKHPVIGYNILKDVKDLAPILNLVKYHHERYDGKGYPEGKTADELSIDIFIIQLADSVDAMSTDRPYRKALSEEKIISEIIRCSGTQFHPKVVEAYLKTKGIDMQSLIKEKAEAEKKGDTLCSLKQ